MMSGVVCQKRGEINKEREEKKREGKVGGRCEREWRDDEVGRKRRSKE